MFSHTLAQIFDYKYLNNTFIEYVVNKNNDIENNDINNKNNDIENNYIIMKIMILKKMI